jgi:6-phosphogluconolactonase
VTAEHADGFGNTARIGHDGRMHLHAYDSATQWTWGAAIAISSAIARDLRERPRARLLLSGGKTPGPVYAALSKSPLPWENVDVALVDERWLLPEDPDSNARLVRETLIQNKAQQARLETITRAGRPFDEALATANLHARQPAGVVVLGMGDDGHTASLFPGMQDLDAALAAPTPYVGVDATGCPGAQRWARRISLTPAGLAPAHTRILLIRGERKRALLEQLLRSDDVHEYPARIALTVPGADLHVHWCP